MGELTQERLKELLYYYPDTGFFIWKTTRGGNCIKGNHAGYLSGRGYIRIRIDDKLTMAHRLAFLYMTGRFPVDEVDHIDHIKTNNSWANIRECSRSENIMNSKIRSDNKSGYKGVFWQEPNKKWRAAITINQKRIHIGMYKTTHEAARAYNEKAIEFHGEFACLNDIINA